MFEGIEAYTVVAVYLAWLVILILGIGYIWRYVKANKKPPTIALLASMIWHYL